MIRSLVSRLVNEPILLVGLAMAALQAFQEATKNQLGPEDALTAAVMAIFTWLGRELVVPMTKVRTGEYVLEDDTPGVPFIEEVND